MHVIVTNQGFILTRLSKTVLKTDKDVMFKDTELCITVTPTAKDTLLVQRRTSSDRYFDRSVQECIDTHS